MLLRFADSGSTITDCSLHCTIIHGYNDSFASWVQSILACKVQILDIGYSFKTSLPPSMFTSNFFVDLRLDEPFDLESIPLNFYFLRFTTLSIRNVVYSDDSLKKACCQFPKSWRPGYSEEWRWWSLQCKKLWASVEEIVSRFLMKSWNCCTAVFDTSLSPAKSPVYVSPLLTVLSIAGLPDGCTKIFLVLDVQ